MQIVDNRITVLATADHIASYNRSYPLVIITGYAHAHAVYIFGFRIYSKGWLF